MFPSKYFAKGYFPEKYWPPVGVVVAVVKRAGSMLSSLLVRRRMHRGRR